MDSMAIPQKSFARTAPLNVLLALLPLLVLPVQIASTLLITHVEMIVPMGTLLTLRRELVTISVDNARAPAVSVLL